MTLEEFLKEEEIDRLAERFISEGGIPYYSYEDAREIIEREWPIMRKRYKELDETR